ncbi:MAG TPA: YceI family protein [Thermoanaerobaculia bacterium]|nr:YceI family protein [Thermoanaerobaculia bacterium]
MRRFLCFAALVITVPVMAATRLAVAPRSVLLLEGSSNVAAWRCRGTTIEGAMTVDAPLAKINEVVDRIEDGNIGVWMSNPAAGSFPAPRFALSIPIDALRCSGGRPMERDMKQALEAGQFPAIDFRLGGLRGPIEHDLDAGVYRATIGGELALAGVRRELTIPVTAQRISRTQFRLRAALPLRMSDFSIVPPTALFGWIKADDRLVVDFDLILEAVP